MRYKLLQGSLWVLLKKIFSYLPLSIRKHCSRTYKKVCVFLFCIVSKSSYTIHQLIHWPLFNTRLIAEDSKREKYDLERKQKNDVKIGLKITRAFWIWMLITIVMTLLPGLLWIVPTHYYKPLSFWCVKALIFLFFSAPLLIYLYQWVVAWNRAKSEVWGIFDHDKAILMLVLGFFGCFVSAALCVSEITSKHSFWLFISEERLYIAYYCASVFLVWLCLTVIAACLYSQLEFLYSKTSARDRNLGAGFLRVFKLSAFNKYDFLPVRVYRKKSISIFIEKIGFYSAMDYDVLTDNNSFMVSKFVLTLFMPLIIPLFSLFFVLFVGQYFAGFNSPSADTPIPIYYIIFNWASISFAYFYWMSKVYLKPLFKKISISGEDFNHIQNDLLYLKKAFDGVKNNVYQFIFVTVIPVYLAIYKIINL